MNEKVKILLAALEFYGNVENHKEDFYFDQSSKVQKDKGKIARAALEKYSEKVEVVS